MFDPDYKALCAELLAAMQTDDWEECEEVWARAQDALEAQPVPVAPTDEELLKLFGQFDVEGMNGETHGMPLDTFWDEYQPREVLAFAHAVLARWGTPANNTNQEDYDCG